MLQLIKQAFLSEFNASIVFQQIQMEIKKQYNLNVGEDYKDYVRKMMYYLFEIYSPKFTSKHFVKCKKTVILMNAVTIKRTLSTIVKFKSDHVSVNIGGRDGRYCISEDTGGISCSGDGSGGSSNSYSYSGSDGNYMSRGMDGCGVDSTSESRLHLFDIKNKGSVKIQNILYRQDYCISVDNLQGESELHEWWGGGKVATPLVTFANAVETSNELINETVETSNDLINKTVQTSETSETVETSDELINETVETSDDLINETSNYLIDKTSNDLIDETVETSCISYNETICKDAQKDYKVDVVADETQKKSCTVELINETLFLGSNPFKARKFKPLVL